MGNSEVDAAAAGAGRSRWWDPREWGFKTKIVLTMYLVWFVVMIAVVSATRNFAVALLVALIPLVLGVFVRWFYVRLFKPFTLWDSSKADIEAGKGHSAERCTRSEGIAIGLLALIMLFAFIPPMLVEQLAGEEPIGLFIFGYNLMGSLLILILVLGCVDFVDVTKGAVLWCRRDRDAEPQGWRSYYYLVSDPRQQRIKAAVCFLLYVGLSIGSLVVSYQAPVVVAQELTLPRLPSCMNGFRIVLVTDVHAGPLVGRAEIARLVDQVNALQPDFILLGGDLADGQPTPESVGNAVLPFKDFVAPVAAVAGNHESLHGSTAEEWLDYYRLNFPGITPLNNSRISLPPAGSSFATACGADGVELVGTEDFAMGEPDIAKALEGKDPNRAALLLAHQPGQAPNAAEFDIDLQFSGHTHAGQTVPLHAGTYLGNPHFAGLEFQEGGPLGGALVYTSQGAFGWGPRTRLGSRNNIDLITLKQGARAEDFPIYAVTVWAFFSLFFWAALVVGIVVFWTCAPNEKAHGMRGKVGHNDGAKTI